MPFPSSLLPFLLFIFLKFTMAMCVERHACTLTLSSGKEQDSDMSPDVTNLTVF